MLIIHFQQFITSQIKLANMKQLLFVLVFLSIMTACEQANVYFESPQPADGKVEQKFDKKYIGKYKSGSYEGVFLEVQKQSITSEYFWKEKYLSSEIDSIAAFEWKGEALYFQGELQKYVRQEDTIEIEKHSKEVIFDLKHDLLKSKNNVYFLNRQDGDFWEVQKLILDSKGNLILSELSDVEEMDKLSQVTKVDSVLHNDSSETVDYYVVRPTDSEFDDIVNGTFFTVEDVYIRIE